MPASLSTEDIEQKLDLLLDVEFSFLKTRHHAETLAALPSEKQHYLLVWIDRIASTNIQLAYQFIDQAVAVLDEMDKNTVEDWALYAMDTYDQAGLHKALAVIRDVDYFIRLNHERTYGASYEDQASVLLHFVHGLSGRQLKIDQSNLGQDLAWTDTETIYLPSLIAKLDSCHDNFLLYKITVTFLWAQVRFGTFRAPLQQILEHHDEAENVQQLFHTLESIRLEACIQRELPGLYRDILRIKTHLSINKDNSVLSDLIDQLEQPQCTSQISLELALTNLQHLQSCQSLYYQGMIKPEQVYQTMMDRIDKEKALIKISLADLEEELNKNKSKPGKLDARFTKSEEEDIERTSIEITLDDQPISVPENIRTLSKSILLDLDDIPAEYLEAAGPGEYDPELFKPKEEDPDDVWKGTYHEEGAFLYNEWDYRRQHYRKNWCAMREKSVTPVYDSFVSDTLNKYSGLIKHLRKTFEAMRDENRVLKRQTDGEEVDIDALVEALTDSCDGSEMTDRLYTRMHKSERNIAVVIMVDMSGSTKGWINNAERESLILLCEALETLDDRYAIYGFSGVARKRCELYTIKTFDEPYNSEIKARISGIQPKDYTRMGFAIRHLSKLLNEIDARTRILITISDGKPDDYDNYRGEYGIEDTRRALIEARRDGIHPYCITIDERARDYLPHMYGPAAFTVLDDVQQLPLKVSDIYRRLTI
ncbi:MAG: VWA domain-containing protein [Gammaproteobacteria bacterium]|nr:VWA domain-containing protein [Gammaproteobacteria bacterium]